MNKAEEQLGVLKRQLAFQYSIILEAQRLKDDRYFAPKLKDNCKEKMRERETSEYPLTIIHAIDFGTIKDWPSFVEYITGEDYEQKPKCETCNDTKEVPAPHYSSKGEAPDCDFITCQKCGVDE